MSTAFGESPTPPEEDGDDIVRALRAQLDAVKARVEAHRAAMMAAGLAATALRPADEG